jgi:hypothetical protein
MKVKKSWAVSGCVLALLGAYSAIGFWGVPYGVNLSLKKYAAPYIGRTVTAQKVRFNPYTLKLEIEGLKVCQSASDNAFISVRDLSTEVSWKSLFKLSPVIDSFKINELKISVERTGLLTFSFSDIIDRIEKNTAQTAAEDKAKPSSPLLFAVGNLQIKNSEIRLDDKFRNRVDVVDHIDFDLPLISNFANEIETPITPRLSFNLNGAPVAVNANSVPFSVSRKTGVSFSLSDIPLENLASFNPVELNANFSRGTLSTKVSVAFAEEDSDKTRDVRHLRLQGNVTLQDFGIADKLENNAEIFSAKELSVNIDDFSYYSRNVKVGEIRLTDPQLLIARNDESINLLTLADHLVVHAGKPADEAEKTAAAPAEAEGKSAEPAGRVPSAAEKEAAVPETVKTGAESADASSEAQDAWSWSLSEFNLVNGTVRLDDQTADYRGEIQKINLKVADLSSRQDKPASISSNLDILGAKAELSGSLVLSPLSVQLTSKLDGLELPQLQPYASLYSGAGIKSGAFSEESTFSYAQTASGPARLEVKGALSLSKVVIADKADSEVVSLEQLSTEDFSFTLDEKTALSLGKIRLSAPAAKVVLLKDGSLNLASLAVPGKPAKNAAKDSEAAKEEPRKTESTASPLIWSLGDLSVENGTVRFTDEAREFSQNINSIKANVGQLSAASDKATPVSVSCSVLEGSVSANGSVLPKLTGASLTIASENLTLPLLKPYIQSFTTADVASALFSNSGTLTLNNISSQEPQIAYRGNAKISHLIVTDSKKQRVASWDHLSADNMEISVTPLSVSLQSLKLANPKINITKDKNGKLNLSSLLIEDKNKKTAPKADSGKSQNSTSDSALPPVSIAKAQVSGGSLIFTDQEMKPPFNLQLSKLNVEASNFSTEGKTNTSFQVKANLNGAPVSLKGTAAPLAKKINLKVDGSATAISLPEFSPFSAEFTGYPIKQGQLNFQADYSIVNSKLESSNTMEISNLRFGEEVPNAKNTLPVGLAVSLLENRNGIIDLNIPVTGSLDDPEFSVGGIIVKVIVNLVTKAVTAPFSLIGSMFGGSPDMDLSRVQFASGSSQLSEAAVKELQVIGKAMTDRPGMKLQLMGLSNPKDDDQGLKESLLMKRIQWEILGGKKTGKLTAAQINTGINRLFRMADGSKPNTDSAEEKKKFLLKSIPITEQDLLELSTNRARGVYNYLAETMKISPNRLFIVTPDKKELSEQAGVKFNIQFE